MAKHPVIEYIEKARKNGAPSKDILKSLTDAGWQEHDVINIVLEHGKLKEEKPAEVAVAEEDVIISVRNLSKNYGKVKALNNVSFDIKRGSVTALLGPNGAGKTTLARILTTLLSPNSGEVTIAGYDLIKDAESLRSLIGVTGQYAAIDEILSGRENLEMVGRLYHLPAKAAKERADELLRQFDLSEAADRPAKTYSGGMKRRLDLAASLVIRPKILFLDEPTTGLDPRSRFDLWHIIRDLVADGTTILLTTQYLEEADQLANKIFVIDKGKIIASGTSEELKRKVGGDIAEVHLQSISDLDKAVAMIRKFGDGEPYTDAEMGIVKVPVKGGAGVLVEIVRSADEAGLKIRDIMLRRPSLDDVFMKLTGRVTDDKNSA